MSNLTENLRELKNPPQRPSNFKKWYLELSSDDQEAVAEAFLDTTIKMYPLYVALHNSGMHISKDTFKAVRSKVISGTSLEDIQ